MKIKLLILPFLLILALLFAGVNKLLYTPDSDKNKNNDR